MKADVSHEQRFMAEVDAFEALARDVEAIQGQLNDWLMRLMDELDARRLVCAGLNPASGLAQQAAAVNAMLAAGRATWARQWSDLEPARTLADTFDDTVIFLVFGKFNAGKSSFSNFLADRFAAHGRAVGYFFVDAGRVVETDEPFKEGATETTARLQGVRLGEKMVLLDTPGLHSVTAENAALTRRFTDSADGVFWLTSSASPGQVQELDQLSRELHRAKPLVPVITRSDRYEEDEIDGALVKRLHNKSAQNRAQQEDDVTARAREKLAAMGIDLAQLKPPVSISVHMARTQGETWAGLEEAGFERLYAAVLALIGPAFAYKRRKPAEILLHHLEENVLGTLRDQVWPALDALRASVELALDGLEGQQERMIDAAWRTMVAALPDLLEQHIATRDETAACHSVLQSLTSVLVQMMKEHFGDYAAVQFDVGGDDLPEWVRFGELTINVQGLCSDDGANYTRIYFEFEKEIRIRLRKIIDAAGEKCRDALQGIILNIENIAEVLCVSEGQLRDLRSEVRMAVD